MNKLALAAFSLGVLALAAVPASAKESLGIFEKWGAFRDASAPRCYAIVKANPPIFESEKRRDYEPYLTVGTWPDEGVRNQLHWRLSRRISDGSRITVRVGNRSFLLSGGGGDAWARDKAMDAAILAALRSATRLQVRGIDARGKRFTDRYDLAGAATAIDAAQLGCAARNL